MHLCGPLDAHLRAVEAAMGVTIARRAELFTVDGPRERAQRVLDGLVTLHGQARQPLAGDTIQLALAEWQADLHAAARSEETAGEGSTTKPGDATPELHTRRGGLKPRTPNQRRYLQQILEHDITFGIGPAGTGKTYLAVACAVDALERQGVQRIVLTRPAVEAGERLGFLPGDLAQKVDPYLRPLYDALYDLMGFDRVTRAFERGQIEIAPLAFMRGRTLNLAFVILDEAQNTTREQMKMFLTRMGFGSRCVVNGDISQIDLPSGIPSGMVEASRLLRQVQGIAFTEFTAADVVRHPLVARIVEAYDADQAQRAGEERFQRSAAVPRRPRASGA
jgi:phosphate starvation-inducible protein PhoH and related proteins